MGHRSPDRSHALGQPHGPGLIVNKLGDKLREQPCARLWEQLDEQLDEQLRGRLGGQLDEQFWRQLWEQLEEDTQ